MSTLAVVEEILRETAVPMSVKEIVERAGSRLPSKSKTPDTVVARDLSMDIKKKGEGSLFIRTSPGRYTLRDLWRHQVAQRDDVTMTGPTAAPAEHAPAAAAAAGPTAIPATPSPVVADTPATSVLSSAMRQDRASPLPVRGTPVSNVSLDDKKSSVAEASRTSG